MAAKTLPSIYGLRGLTCSTLFGLIAVTGLRISEALALDHDDLDVENGVLRVRRGKLGKERLLPLDQRWSRSSSAILAERDRLLGSPAKPLFVTDKATRLTDCAARYNFARACQQIGFGASAILQAWPGTAHPRLRHSFAVKTMIDWYRTGKDPARQMIRLTTYLGHREPRQHILVSGSGARTARSGDGTGNLQWRGGEPMNAATLPALIRRACGPLPADRRRRAARGAREPSPFTSRGRDRRLNRTVGIPEVSAMTASEPQI